MLNTNVSLQQGTARLVAENKHKLHNALSNSWLIDRKLHLVHCAQCRLCIVSLSCVCYTLWGHICLEAAGRQHRMPACEFSKAPRVEQGSLLSHSSSVFNLSPQLGCSNSAILNTFMPNGEHMQNCGKGVCRRGEFATKTSNSVKLATFILDLVERRHAAETGASP